MPQELTNALRRLAASLDAAKARRQEGLFAAEGTKCVLDLLGHFPLAYLFATPAWVEAHAGVLPRSVEPIVVHRADMERMTHLTTAPDVMALFRIVAYEADTTRPEQQLVLALDCVQDPGNLGTIIRAADWFGVRSVVCSPDTADLYNPKVVQATMGAIARVEVAYTSLPEYFAALKPGTPVAGTFLDGSNIYADALPDHGVVVMGNEGRGISAAVAACVNRRLRIPSWPPGEPTSESLNVAMATAITLAEFRRQLMSR